MYFCSKMDSKSCRVLCMVTDIYLNTQNIRRLLTCLKSHPSINTMLVADVRNSRNQVPVLWIY